MGINIFASPILMAASAMGTETLCSELAERVENVSGA